MTKTYYANAQGFQLKDFMKEMHKIGCKRDGEIYSMEEGFFFLNAVKYKVRAGLKDESTFNEDMAKNKDYIEDLKSITETPVEIILDSINFYVNAFYVWNGEIDTDFEDFYDNL